MKEMCVQVGCSSLDPEQHCFDGDSSYVTGSFENELVRLLGIDAFEVRGLNLYYLRKSGFLSRLDYSLRKYLEPKLTNESIGIHKNLGFEARDFLESILEEDLVVSLRSSLMAAPFGPVYWTTSYGSSIYRAKPIHPPPSIA